MAVHCIIIDDKSEDNIKAVRANLDTHYPVNYKYHSTDQVVFVSTSDTTKSVSEKAGFAGDNPIAGAVFKMNSGYSGLTDRSIWEWLALDAAR